MKTLIVNFLIFSSLAGWAETATEKAERLCKQSNGQCTPGIRGLEENPYDGEKEILVLEEPREIIDHDVKVID